MDWRSFGLRSQKKNFFVKSHKQFCQPTDVPTVITKLDNYKSNAYVHT